MSHIRLEDRDGLAPHRCCCVEVALGQLDSAVLVCWVAAPLGRWHRRTALAILLPSSSLIILACSLPGRKMVPFLRVGRRRHSGAVAGCGPRQFAHLGGQVWGSAERHDFWGCSAVAWLVDAQTAQRWDLTHVLVEWKPWHLSHWTIMGFLSNFLTKQAVPNR